MVFTSIPSIKGQITLPPAIRKKYQINKETPLKIEDKGNGILILKVMKMINYGDVQYFENEKQVKLSFPKGVDPQILIDKITEIDG